jgi:hypothetical protein
MNRVVLLISLLLLLWGSVACSTKASGQDAEASATSHIFGSKQIALPAGTVVTVRLASAVGSKLSASGDPFSSTVAQPVEVDGKVVVPIGAEALGKVVEAVPQGRFKGAAVPRLVLESVNVAMKITERLVPIRIHCGVDHYGDALDYHQVVGVRLFFGIHSGCKSLQPEIVLFAS